MEDVQRLQVAVRPMFEHRTWRVGAVVDKLESSVALKVELCNPRYRVQVVFRIAEMTEGSGHVSASFAQLCPAAGG